MSIRERIIHQLAALYPALQQLQDPHYLIGASAMILTGVPIATTSDIDLLTSGRDATLLQSLWSSQRLDTYQPGNPDKFRSQFARFSFGPMDVEVMGRLEVFHEGNWHVLEIEEAIQVPNSTAMMPTLAEHQRILALFGRPKDLERISLIQQYTASGR